MCPKSLFQGAEYTQARKVDQPSRVSRTGLIQGSEKAWREEDFLGSGGSMSQSRSIAYHGVPKDKVELFDRALSSFIWAEPVR
jgi:hypothetical protein